MAFMEWNPTFSVGIAQFDEEHKRLVKMLNDLHAAMLKGKGSEVLGAILDGLISYTKTHFANEEKYMVQHQYPDYRAHKAEHDALARKVLAVQAQFKQGGKGATLSMDVLNFLSDWLVKHIMGSDRKYQPFLSAKGVK